MISKLLTFSLLLFHILFKLNHVESMSTTKDAVISRFTNETDRRALLAIKARITVDPYRVFSSWNDSLHFCKWQEVTCSRPYQRATALHLSSLRLAGDLSPYVGNLTFLRVIELGNNSFHGPIPQEVSRLYRLQVLSLVNNSFQGALPTNLTHCSKLEVVNLNSNKLEGKIPTELGSLPRLNILQLSLNNFRGTIPPSLGNISSLLSLALILNQLEGNIPTELGRLSNLKFLQLALNKFSGIVPTQLYNISSIFHFSVAGNQLNGQIFPDLGLTLPNLRLIYMADNKFSGPIPASIVNCSGLLQLDMALNALTGAVPKNFGSLRNLQVLNFAGNLLGSSNDLSFLSSLTNCTNLIELWFDRNNLSGTLPDSIANLSTSLISLRLGLNYISGNIPTGIENLVSLEYLALPESMISGSIPDSIGKLSRLKYFYFYTNRIVGEIPSSFGNMTNLVHFILRENLLEGGIPASLGNCIYLEALDLSHNHLNGMIPKEVIGLSSFSIGLQLASNNLTGQLPPEIGNCKNIISLEVAGNKLYGEIPSSLGNCLMLEELSLRGNSFEGTIPSSLSKLRSMQVLDLSNNNLSGQIPEFLGELPLLININMSFNSFEGKVPTKGVFDNISAFSVLGNSKLCGGIKPLRLPACPAEFAMKGKNFPLRAIIAIVVVCFIVLFLACLFAINRWVCSSKSKERFASLFEKTYLKLSYAELLHATEGFSLTNLIGKGRYGSVYKGILSSDAQTVAMKVLNLQERGANRTFAAECKILRNLRHRNHVKVITSCSSIDFQSNDFKALVFEFMPNGSLESWLHLSSTEQQDSRSLNLVQRLNIAIDIASALDYLHYQFDKPVVHCDLKPSNVLLDSDLIAHVSDFGLAKFPSVTTDESVNEQSSSIGIRGTVGYIPPEYGMGSEISTAGDVYSYGVLLMELFTSKSPTGSMFTGEMSLHDYVKRALPEHLVEIVDPKLIFKDGGVFNQTGESSNKGTSIGNVWKCLASVLDIGVICSADLPGERMNIRDVLTELHRVRNILLEVEDHRRRERLKLRNINQQQFLNFNNPNQLGHIC